MNPVPELQRNKDRLAVFVFGNCGAGKSTFVSNYIHRHNPNITSINADDISYLLTRDESSYIRQASVLAWRKVLSVVKGGNSFVHDNTGNFWKDVAELVYASKQNGYKVIFFHLLVPVHVALVNNRNRPRNAPDKYIIDTHNNTQHNIKNLASLEPDKYVIVDRTGGTYRFNTYNNGQIISKHNAKRFRKNNAKKHSTA